MSPCIFLGAPPAQGPWGSGGLGDKVLALDNDRDFVAHSHFPLQLAEIVLISSSVPRKAHLPCSFHILAMTSL